MEIMRQLFRLPKKYEVLGISIFMMMKSATTPTAL